MTIAACNYNADLARTFAADDDAEREAADRNYVATLHDFPELDDERWEDHGSDFVFPDTAAELVDGLHDVAC